MSNLQNKVSSPWDKFPVYLLLLPIHTLASHITSFLPGMPSPRSFPGFLWNKCKVSGYRSFSQKPLLVPSVCSHSSLTSSITVLSLLTQPSSRSSKSLISLHYSLLIAHTHGSCAFPCVCDSLMNVWLPHEWLPPLWTVSSRPAGTGPFSCSSRLLNYNTKKIKYWQ